MQLIDFTYYCLGTKFRASTIGKHHPFVGVFKFVGLETNEYKLVFIGFDQALMNIWSVWFDFDQTHIFVGDATNLYRTTWCGNNMERCR
jgi:hypothetical protein